MKSSASELGLSLIGEAESRIRFLVSFRSPRHFFFVT